MPSLIEVCRAVSASLDGSDDASEWKLRLALLFGPNEFCSTFSCPPHLSFYVIRMLRPSVLIDSSNSRKLKPLGGLAI